MKHKIQNITYLILMLVAGTGISKSYSQTSWKGTSSSSWSSSNNWTAGVPTSSTDAIIGDSYFTGSYQPTVGSSANCKSLTVGGSKSATLTIDDDIGIAGSITINSKGTISHTDNTITLTGNWSNSGSYSASNSSSSVVFGGSAQTIGGSTATTFRRLTINSGSTVKLNSDISVSGSSGRLLVSGTLNPSESPTYIVSGTGTYTVYSGGTLKVNASTFAGNYTLSGTATFSSGCNVDYSSTTTDQTVTSSITYSTLTISGSGTKSLSQDLSSLKSSASGYGNIYVTGGTFDLSSYTANRGTSNTGGTLSVTNDATLKIGGTNSIPSNYNTISFGSTSTVEFYGSTQSIPNFTYGNLSLTSAGTKTPGANLTIAGNFTLKNGTFAAGNYKHSIGGNWNMTGGTYTNTGNTIILNGSSNQTITSTGNFNKLQINNNSNINLGSNITVNDSLTLLAGKIALESYNLTLGSSAKIIGASSSNYIIATGTGILTQSITNGGTKIFPIGSSSDYFPATIALTSGSTSDNFSINLKPELRSRGTSGAVISSKAVNATWYISEQTDGGSNATITLQWNGSCELASLSKTGCRLIHFSNNSWDCGSSDLSISGSNPYTISRSGFTSFSPFGISNLTALPVTWVNLSGEHLNGDNYIHWTTASEINNEYFAIESSTDGISFSEIGRIKGSINANNQRNYSFVHTHTNEAIYYYRIKQVDNNGDFEYSKVIEIIQNLNSELNSISLFPNPISSSATVNILLNHSNDLSIIITDLNGKTMSKQNSHFKKGNNAITLDTEDLPNGIYILKILNDSGFIKITKFVKN